MTTQGTAGDTHARDAEVATTRRPRRITRQWKAIAAGGGVMALGVGFAVAAWTDDAKVSREIQTGSFDIEASVDGVTWADHATGDGGTLAVADGADYANFTPGDVAYSAVYLRQSDAGNLPAEITLDAGVVSGSVELAGALRYSAAATVGAETATCNAAAFNDPWVPLVGDGALTTGSTDTLHLAGTDVITVCFRIWMEPDAPVAAQGKSVKVVWNFHATSG